MLNQGELDRSEMGRLIGSDKVEGTSVYGADRNKIGSIERVAECPTPCWASAVFSASAMITTRCLGSR
jgi:hypothetical protein